LKARTVSMSSASKMNMEPAISPASLSMGPAIFTFCRLART
jgi:hypothetical protein